MPSFSNVQSVAAVYISCSSVVVVEVLCKMALHFPPGSEIPGPDIVLVDKCALRIAVHGA